LPASPLIVAAGEFGDAVVGDYESLDLGLRQILNEDGRDFGQASLARGLPSGVPNDDHPGGIAEDGDAEAKGLDHLRQAAELSLAVAANVRRT
jgi:hypothetical protein